MVCAMLHYFLKYLVLSFFIVLIGSDLKLQAQNKICDLRISLFEYIDTNPSETIASLFRDETNVIADAQAIAFNNKSKKTITGILKDRTPYFQNLAEGDYKITISKNGFKKTQETFIHSCDNVDVSNKFCKGVYLRRGNITELIIERPNTSFTLGEIEPGGDCYLPLPPPIKFISGGIVNGKAINLVKPIYPETARKVNVSGVVNVMVVIDIDGKVISAEIQGGNQLLQNAALVAAKASLFPPTTVNGDPVKVVGVIVYNVKP